MNNSGGSESIGESTGGATLEEIYSLVERDNFSDYIPLQWPLEKGVYRLSDGDIGLVWGCTPLLAGGDETMDSLGAIFKDASLKDGDAITTINNPSEKTSGVLSNYLKSDKVGGLPAEMAVSSAEHLLAGGRGLSDTSGRPVLLFKLYFCLRLNMRGGKRDVRSILSNTEQTLRMAGLHPQRTSAGEMAGWLRDILGQPYVDKTAYNSKISMARQICRKDLYITARGLCAGNLEYRFMRMVTHPQNTTGADTNLLMGNFVDPHENLFVPTPHMVVTTAVRDDGMAENIKFMENLVSVARSGRNQSSSAANNREKAEEHNEYVLMAQGLKSGEFCWRIITTIALYAPFAQQERLDDAVSGITALYRRGGYELELEKTYRWQSLLNCIPFGLRPLAPHNMRRGSLRKAMDLMAKYLGTGGSNKPLLNELAMDVPMLSKDVPHILQIYGDTSGSGEVALLGVGRRGGLTRLGLFEGARAHNGVVIGGTGGGKSVLLSKLINEMVRTGGRAVLVELGRSQKQFIKTLMDDCSGMTCRHIEVGPGQGIVLNPFSFINPGIRVNHPDWQDGGRLWQLKQLVLEIIKPSPHNRQHAKQVEAAVEYGDRDNERGEELTPQMIATKYMQQVREELMTRIKETAGTLIAMAQMDTSQNRTLLDALATGAVRYAFSNPKVEDGLEVQACIDWLRKFPTLVPRDDVGLRALLNPAGKPENAISSAALLSAGLSSWGIEGEFGAYVTGITEIDFGSDQLVVMELEQIKDMPVVLKIMMGQIVNAATRAVYLGTRTQPTLTIFDEYGAVMEIDGVGEESEVNKSIGRAGRTYRKYVAGIWLATQGPQDTEYMTKGMKSNIIFKIYLQQDPAQLEAAISAGLIPYTGLQLALLKRITTVRGKFSELFVDADGDVFVMRLVLSPLEKAVYFANPDALKSRAVAVASGTKILDVLKEEAVHLYGASPTTIEPSREALLSDALEELLQFGDETALHKAEVALRA